MSETKIEDSNLANYGGKDHEDAKEKKAQGEKAFKGAGKNIGVEVWRVEKFRLRKLEQKEIGAFFRGDSYIILNTYEIKTSTGAKKKAYNVHFWLGSETTQDEAGTAAYKTVELDDLLGDLPVQFRETEGHESTEFMKCFGGKIRVMAGGIESGFHKVGPKQYKARLLKFKGKKRIRATEVKMSRASLNQGDVFLLDNGLELIQWNGPRSNAREKRAAMNFIISIKDARLGRASSRVLDGDEDDEVFWSKLGGKGSISPAEPDKKVKKVAPKLFRVSDASGSMVVQQIAEGKGEMKRSLIDEDDAYILDVGQHIYIYIGSGANRAERREAMNTACKHIKTSGKPEWTPVTRVLSGQKIMAFDGMFT